MGFMDIFRREGRDKKQDFITFADVRWPQPTHAGINVTQDTAPYLPAVYRCWSLNADVIATMPVDILVKRGKERLSYPEPLWFKSPNDFQDWVQFIRQVQLSYESDGNAFILKAVAGNGQVAGLYPLPPSTVEVVMTDLGVVYEVRMNDGDLKRYAATEIIHIRGLTPAGHLRGLSPIECMKQTLGIGFAAEQFGAQFFGAGATVSGVITVPATAGKFGPDEADRLKDAFERKHGGITKSHAVGVLTGGATWTPVSVNPEESQFLETRTYTDVQIAHMYGVPPNYVTNTEGTKGYVSGLYADRAIWLVGGINPRLVNLERAFSALLPGNAYLRWNRNSFLQMEPQERVTMYSAGLRDQWLTPNEVRALEDKDPVEGGDKMLPSVQYYHGEMQDFDA
jgi:HK97 family phage portal protein